jgi:hypothetical protein
LVPGGIVVGTAGGSVTDGGDESATPIIITFYFK